MDETVTQKIERARAYLAGVRTVTSATPAGDVVQRLAGHLGEMLAIVDDQYLCLPPPAGERARARAELLAEVPASERAPGYPDADFSAAVATTLVRVPGDVAAAVTRWLRAAKREAGLTPAQRATALGALDLAAEELRDRAATCPDCDVDPADLCGTCAHRLARAEEFDALAETLRGQQ